MLPYAFMRQIPTDETIVGHAARMSFTGGFSALNEIFSSTCASALKTT